MKRLLTLILILTVNNLAGQEIKKINSERSTIGYTGNHYLHKWSADNTNISGLIQLDEKSILNIGKPLKNEIMIFSKFNNFKL